MTREDGRTTRARALREERRQQILDAALEIFADSGYHRASISDIVKRAKVARGTFYLYFDSKHAIFAELLEDLLTGFRGTVVGVDTSGDAPPLLDQLVETVRLILDAACSSRAVATIIFREALTLDEEVDARVQAFEDRLHAYVRTSLDNGIALGLLRPHDASVVATCVYGSIRQVIHRVVVLEPDDEPDLEHLAGEIVRFALSGVVAKGIPVMAS